MYFQRPTRTATFSPYISMPTPNLAVAVAALQEDRSPGIELLLTAQRLGEAPPLSADVRAVDARERQQGWRQVGDLDRLGDRSPASEPRRPANDERHADRFLVDHEPMVHPAVLHERFAVITDDRHQRVVEDPALGETIEELPELRVGVVYLSVVGSDLLVDVRGVLTERRKERRMLWRRNIGIVGVEEMDEQQERRRRARGPYARPGREVAVLFEPCDSPFASLGTASAEGLLQVATLLVASRHFARLLLAGAAWSVASRHTPSCDPPAWYRVR
jgi:hypothetical protein